MDIIKLILPITLITSVTSLVGAQPAVVSPVTREGTEWCNILISHANETNLPRVLLIGDSITQGYSYAVEERLAGKAYVAHLTASCFISDPVLLQEIALVLDNTKFDIIHFNNGLHGWQYSEKDYGDAFPRFLATIKAHAPNAKLIWANSTTMKVSPSLPPGEQTQPSDERIAQRNAIALRYIKPAGIDVDDLNSLLKGHPEYHRDSFHFNDQGIALQAAQVATHIEKMLNP